MRYRTNENAAPDVAVIGNGAEKRQAKIASISYLDFTTLPLFGQGKVAGLLGYGKDAAVTAKTLCALLHARSRREISAEIERERQAWIPICASNNSACLGYYLPSDEAELWHYILSLRRRHAAIGRTLRAMEDVHDGMTGQLRMKEGIK